MNITTKAITLKSTDQFDRFDSRGSQNLKMQFKCAL